LIQDKLRPAQRRRIDIVEEGLRCPPPRPDERLDAQGVTPSTRVTAADICQFFDDSAP